MKKSAAHIGHILPYEAIGGTEHATLQLAKTTRNAGYKNTFFVLDGCVEIRDFFEREGFAVENYTKNEIGLRSPHIYLRESKKLANVFSGLQLNMIHCADLPAVESVAFAGFLAKIPLVSHVRNRHETFRKRDKLLLRLINRFLFVSKNTRENFPLEISETRAEILYDGIETDEIDEVVRRKNRESVRQEFNISPDVKIIGTLARVATQKDFFTLGKAVKTLVDKGKPIKVLIVGSTSKEEAHREHFLEVSDYLKELGVFENFIFTDFRTDTMRFLHAFDVFVLSTHYEGFPLVNLEAMAQRIPVAATAVDGVPEAIKNGQTGFLYEHENADQLAAILEKLLDDPVYAEKIGQAGFHHIKANFSRKKYAEDVLRIYGNVLKTI
jgi:glycosyltransferase involved in cell wall biosynthesis